MSYSERTTCRICGATDLVTVLDFGNPYICNFVDSASDDAPRAQLQVALCQSCSLPQLRHTVDPESLYRTYWYKSGVNKSMRDALSEITEIQFNNEGELTIGSGAAVLDIGCNDGTLLGHWAGGVYRVGFEPATALAVQAEEHADWIIPNFFRADVLHGIWFKIITSIALFYDLDDPGSFVQQIKKILHPNGIWIVEMQYLVDVLGQNAFDFWVHEHLACYSITSLKTLLDRHGLIITDCVTTNTNGGSFRCYVRHPMPSINGPKRKPSQRVNAMLARERYLRIDDPKTYEDFSLRIKSIRQKILDYLSDYNRIYLCGASTKGNTLVQYFGLDNNRILGAAERNPEKHGKLTAGTWIPIVPEEEARKDAEIMIVLPWHFFAEIREREIDYLQQGGKLLFPLPKPIVVTKGGVEEL